MHQAVITLSLMDDFQCTGAKCLQSCCAAPWEIGVDAETMARWQTVESSKTRERLLKAISSESGHTTRDPLLRRDAAQRCVLLRDDGLCGVQAELGHEHIPSTCRSYPRLTRRGESHTLHSGALSCPEVVRLVMAGSQSGELFRRSGEPLAASPAVQNRNSNLDRLMDITLGARQFELGVRVAYLARCVGEMTAALQQCRSPEALLAGFAQDSEKEMTALGALSRQGLTEQDRVRAGRFWNLLHVMGQRARVESNAGEEAARLRMALDREERTTESFYTEVYAAVSAAREIARPMMRAHADGLERCLRVMLAAKGLPWEPNAGHYTAALLHVLLPLGWLHLVLWQMSGRQVNPSDPALLIWLTVHTERAYAHSRLVLDLLSRNRALLNTELYHTFFLDFF